MTGRILIFSVIALCYLVDVDHGSGWHWRSSMSRNDTGDGACELVYVESMSVEASG